MMDTKRETKVLSFADDLKIVVFDTLHQLTTYVLEEQRDWFEWDLRAVRQFVSPGDTVIDIGANLGVYALSLARCVGPAGRVIAFEPTSAVAELLRRSAALNHFSHLRVDGRAVGASSGTACLKLSDRPELNEIVPTLGADAGPDPGEEVEQVSVISLDQWSAEQSDLAALSLIKIDAEGQEQAIIQGARQMLQQHSPLILYEVQNPSGNGFDNVQEFAQLGYQSYRLIPGLMILEPFRGEADPFLLNLFCCKPDRAERLARQSQLVREIPPAAAPVAEQHHWQALLAGLPYARRQEPVWQANAAAFDASPLATALALYALSQDPQAGCGDRVAALARCVELLKSACQEFSSPIHLSSLARAAYDYGLQSLSLEALSSLVSAIPYLSDADFQEPFLAPDAGFAAIEPIDSLQNWLLAGALEAYVLRASHSSYFGDPQMIETVRLAANLGYGSDALQRRLRLLEQRAG